MQDKKFSNDIEIVNDFYEESNSFRIKFLKINKNLKILITMQQEFEKKLGGIFKFNCELIEQFVKNKHSITVIFNDEVKYYNQNNYFDYNTINDYFDLIIVNNATHLLLKKFGEIKIPILNIIHSEFFDEDIPFHKANPELAGYAENIDCKFLAVRNEIKNHLIENYKIDKEKIKVILNPIEYSYFNNVNTDQKLNYGIFPGNFNFLREKPSMHFANFCKQKNLKSIFIGFVHEEDKKIVENCFDEVLEHSNDITDLLSKASLIGGIQKGRTFWESKILKTPNLEYSVDKEGNILFHHYFENNYDEIELFKIEKLIDSENVAEMILFYSLSDKFADNSCFQKLMPKLNLSEINFSLEKKFEIASHKYKLDNLTICIPAFIDSDERINNLNKCIDNLNKFFDVKIYVIEMSHQESKIHSKSNFTHIFLNKNFNRGKAVNYFINQICKTDFVLHLETDVLLNPLGILESYENLVKKQFDFSFPFNGLPIPLSENYSTNFDPYLSVPKFWKLIYDFDLSFFEIKNDKHVSINLNYKHTGYAFMFNKKTYEKFGFENENFNYLGSDDNERYIRLKKFGNEIHFSKYFAYHLWHPRSHE